jgi:mRNA interferase RelE/StbE
VAKYRILIKPSAIKEIEAIPLKKDRRRIVDRINKLGEDPRPPGCEKLSGQDKYRIRQGRYRIVYSIEDQDLVVYVLSA